MTIPRQESIPYVEVPIQDENGAYILDYVLGQDMVAWYRQGEITETKEHLRRDKDGRLPTGRC